MADAVQRPRRSRLWLTLGVGLVLVLALGFAFAPRPVMVDMADVAKRPMMVTISEEAKTRVRDAYMVSAPSAGRLLRPDVEAGDAVVAGETIIARMLPINSAALDPRARQQAKAAVNAARAALNVAEADVKKVLADRDLAEADLERTRKLYEKGNVSKAALDRAERAWRATSAALDTARAAVAVRRADLATARAQLSDGGAVDESQIISVAAPVSGRIMRIMQESETTVAAGMPIMEIGDIANDLEIEAELLSTDAVQIKPGNRVIIDNWGGDKPLNGRVERVEPWGFTKFSALGVEEQRVRAIIQFTDPWDQRQSLGHGFRVEARIVTWESNEALTVPSAALFRDGTGWSSFVVQDDEVTRRAVTVGHNNGSLAEIIDGLSDGDQVVLYPGPDLADGVSVAQRSTE